MKAPWNALYALWSADDDLVALLAADERGDPAIYPAMRDEVEDVDAFPMLTTPGLTSQARPYPTLGDSEISTWLTVLEHPHQDPEGLRDAIELRLAELAEGTQAGAWFFEGVRVSVRLVGVRDANQPGRLRRRHIWTVGVN